MKPKLILNVETKHYQYKQNEKITLSVYDFAHCLGGCAGGKQLTGNESEYELLKKGYNRITVKDYKGEFKFLQK